MLEFTFLIFEMKKKKKQLAVVFFTSGSVRKQLKKIQYFDPKT